jgi:hypothetical protein
MQPIHLIEFGQNLPARGHPPVFERHQSDLNPQVTRLLPSAKDMRKTLPLRFSHIRCGGDNLLQRLKNSQIRFRVYHAPPPFVGGAKHRKIRIDTNQMHRERVKTCARPKTSVLLHTCCMLATQGEPCRSFANRARSGIFTVPTLEEPL